MLSEDMNQYVVCEYKYYELILGELCFFTDMHTLDHADLHWTYIIG